jgi:hypothetical protein
MGNELLVIEWALALFQSEVVVHDVDEERTRQAVGGLLGDAKAEAPQLAV